jgi:competence protein ComEA
VNSLQGVAPLVVLVLCVFLVAVGRQVSFGGNPSAVSFSGSEKVYVELGQGFRRPGIYQFSDAYLLQSVIILTDLDCVSSVPENWLDLVPRKSGMHVALSCNGLNSHDFSFSWMSAAKRIALSVPLHPDHMSLSDWEALPGIGPRLAARIEEDRQKNGDFGGLHVLRRVSGIGPKRIKDWEGYFSFP